MSTYADAIAHLAATKAKKELEEKFGITTPQPKPPSSGGEKKFVDESGRDVAQAKALAEALKELDAGRQPQNKAIDNAKPAKSSKKAADDVGTTATPDPEDTDTPIEPDEPSGDCSKTIDEDGGPISVKLLDSQLWTPNNREQCVIYTDTISKEIPGFDLSNGELVNLPGGVEVGKISIPAIPASPTNPIAIFWYNRVSNGNFDHASSIPCFYKKEDGGYEAFMNCYIPRIDYDPSSERLRMSFWTNADGEIAYLSQNLSIGCEVPAAESPTKKKFGEDGREIAEVGSIDPLDKSGGSTSSAMKPSKDKLDRVFFMTEGDPVHLQFVDSTAMPFTVVYIFNEPIEIMRQKGGISEFDFGMSAATLISDNVVVDCDQKNQSTKVLAGDCVKEGDLDDQWLVTDFIADDKKCEPSKPPVTVELSGGGTVTTTINDKGGTTSSVPNEKAGRSPTTGHERLTLWLNPNSSESTDDQIKGGIVARRDKRDDAPSTAMLRDALYLDKESGHLKIPSHAQFMYKKGNLQKEAKAEGETRVGPLEFTKRRSWSACTGASGGGAYFTWTRTCGDFPGNFQFKHKCVEDEDPSNGCMCAVGFSSTKYTDANGKTKTIEGKVTTKDGITVVKDDGGNLTTIPNGKVKSSTPLKPHIRTINATRKFAQKGSWIPVVTSPVYTFTPSTPPIDTPKLKLTVYKGGGSGNGGGPGGDGAKGGPGPPGTPGADGKDGKDGKDGGSGSGGSGGGRSAVTLTQSKVKVVSQNTPPAEACPIGGSSVPAGGAVGGSRGNSGDTGGYFVGDNPNDIGRGAVVTIGDSSNDGNPSNGSSSTPKGSGDNSFTYDVSGIPDATDATVAGGVPLNTDSRNYYTYSGGSGEPAEVGLKAVGFTDSEIERAKAGKFGHYEEDEDGTWRFSINEKDYHTHVATANPGSSLDDGIKADNTKAAKVGVTVSSYDVANNGDVIVVNQTEYEAKKALDKHIEEENKRLQAEDPDNIFAPFLDSNGVLVDPSSANYKLNVSNV